MHGGKTVAVKEKQLKEIRELIRQIRQQTRHMIRILGEPDVTLNGTPIEQTDLKAIYKTGLWKHEFVYQRKWETIILRVKESETGMLHFFTTNKEGQEETEYLF